MKAVLDTSGWYAYVSKDDLQHEEGAAFVAERHELFILETVFEEITALLHNRFGKKVAVEHGSALIEVGFTLLTQEDIRHAWSLFRNTPTQVSFVDCTAVIASKKFRLPVFGFNSHFRNLRIALVP